MIGKAAVFAVAMLAPGFAFAADSAVTGLRRRPRHMIRRRQDRLQNRFGQVRRNRGHECQSQCNGQKGEGGEDVKTTADEAKAVPATDKAVPASEKKTIQSPEFVTVVMGARSFKTRGALFFLVVVQ